MKVLGVNIFFLASATVLTPIRFEFWGKPKVLGGKHLASTKLVCVRSDKCWVLWTTIMKACGGVRVIKKKGAVNVVLIIKFIKCH